MRQLMSALGQKQTYAVQNVMSTLPPKADMCSAPALVCFGPIADSCTAAKFDNLVDVQSGLPNDETICIV
jgi:hypothetical protein